VQDTCRLTVYRRRRLPCAFHGERYPLVRNDSAAARAKNRRVTLRLEREAASETAATAPATPAS